jgi:hypothetical protein
MKPGQYMGDDARTYRWTVGEGGYGHWRYDCGWRVHPVVDWPAAKAALDALIESESEQWVYLESDGEPVIRISATGERVQQQDHAGKWTDYSAWWIKEAYRKGRELERAKCAKLREAVLGADGVIGEGVKSWGYTIEGPHWDRIVALAKGGE